MRLTSEQVHTVVLCDGLLDQLWPEFRELAEDFTSERAYEWDLMTGAVYTISAIRNLAKVGDDPAARSRTVQQLIDRIRGDDLER